MTARIAGSDKLLMFLLWARRPEKYRRAADINIDQRNAVFLMPKQTAERLRLLGLAPPLLKRIPVMSTRVQPAPPLTLSQEQLEPLAVRARGSFPIYR